MATVTINITSSGSQPSLEIRRIRKWGDPIMLEWGFDYNLINTSNFQAIRTWNDGNLTWGGVTNFLRIPNNEVLRIRDMQIPETTDTGYYDRDSKMNWLAGGEQGKMYFDDTPGESWKTADFIRWGTVGIGGNLVQVERYEEVFTSISGEPKRYYNLARLVGFRSSDWDKPLDELLATGLVHRCYCVYRNNGIGDTPKGIIYSPFFSPLDYDFAGTARPTALYIPTMWFEDK